MMRFEQDDRGLVLSGQPFRRNVRRAVGEIIEVDPVSLREVRNDIRLPEPESVV
jgi:hypothetical protein